MNLALQFATCTQCGLKGIAPCFSCRGLLRRIYHSCYLPPLRIEDPDLEVELATTEVKADLVSHIYFQFIALGGKLLYHLD